MKIFRRLFAIAVAAFATIGTSSAYAGTWLENVKLGTSPNLVNCSIRTGDTVYPGNGNFVYCGDPALRSTNGMAVLQTVQNQSTFALSALNAVPVTVYVFRDWATYKTALSLTTGIADPVGTLGTSLITGPSIRSSVVQFTDLPGAPGTNAVYARNNGAMMHELGHQLDPRMTKPSGQLYHSQYAVGGTQVWYNKLLKDSTFINTQTPCTQIFQTDKVMVNGVLTPICNSSGQLIPPYLGKSNFLILQMLYPYFFNADTTIIGGVTTTTFSELWSEQISALTSPGTEALYSGKSYDHYLQNTTYFQCTTWYVQRLLATGSPPLNSTYSTRCQ